MRRFPNFPALFGLVAGLGLLAGTAQATSTVILPPNGTAVGANPAIIRGVLRGVVADELRGFSVLNEAKTAALVAQAKELNLTCGALDTDCLLKLGILGGVDLIISPQLSTENDEAILTVAAVDASTGTARGVAKRSVTKSDAATASRSAIIEILAPDRYRGRLAVNANAEGADVLVDGVSQGATPLPAPLELTAGPHKLDVKADGFVPFSQEVEVPFESLVAIDVSLAKVGETVAVAPPQTDDQEGAESTWRGPALLGLGAATGIAAVAAIATGAFAIVENGTAYGFLPNQAWFDLGKPPPNEPLTGLLGSQIISVVALVAMVTTVALGATTGAVFLLE